jgi:multiple sugar transport system permease protein
MNRLSNADTGPFAQHALTSKAAVSRRKRRGVIGIFLVSPALLLIAVIFVLPLLIAVWMSMSSWPLLGHHHFTGLANYERLIHDRLVHQSLIFTFEFAVIATPITFCLGLGLACLVQYKRRGVGLIRTAIFAPVVIGFAAASYLWLSISDPSTGVFDRFLVDTHVTRSPVNWLISRNLAMLLVLIVTVWKTVGFAMIALMNGLQSVSADVEDAARVDGAGRFRLLWQIKMPLMKNSVAFALTFIGIGAFLSFDQFFILTSGGPNNQTITAVYRIYNTAFIQDNLGYAAASSLVFLAIVLLITSTQLLLLRRGSDQ